MDRLTGAPLPELEHIKQSVAEILLTPTGSRLERRDFGSCIPALIDRPWSRALELQLMAAAVTALARWEPRIRIRSAAVRNPHRDGRASLELVMETHTGQDVTAAIGLGLVT